MWFIFPQLSGLGHSAMAQRYAIRNLAEARCYLADPVLGPRLRRDVGLVMTHTNKTAREIFGAPDDLKFRSCLTLFREAADDESERTLFTKALDQFYDAGPDPHTLELLQT